MAAAREKIATIVNGAVEYERGLDELTIMPSTEVDPALAESLERAFAARWRGGWQPVELHRLVTRRCGPVHASLVTDAVAASLVGLSRETVDARWLAQSESLNAAVWWSSSATYLHELGMRWRRDRSVVLDIVLTVLGVVARLPAIEVLVPAPGLVAPANPRNSGDTQLLRRVRALLAKAESTTHPAEAEAYTAKAQQLVSRHSLDTALLATESAQATIVPYARRIAVDPPYEHENAALLNAVAGANHCHMVWSPEFGFATVFGFDSDLDAVDLIYASLLVQGQRSMAQSEPPAGRAGRARQRAYRQSFLVAYATRIAERLAGAAEAARAEAEATNAETAALVLAARDEQVQESMRKTFPRTVRGRSLRADSDEGWTSGQAAADTVTLPPH